MLTTTHVDPAFNFMSWDSLGRWVLVSVHALHLRVKMVYGARAWGLQLPEGTLDIIRQDPEPQTPHPRP